jgi:peptide/nickel transport system permease protein
MLFNPDLHARGMRWFIRRVGQAIITLVSVVSISFALVRLLPGGPLDFIRGQLLSKYGTGSGAQKERVNRLVEVYTNIRPDEPIWDQYINYLVSVFQGDLGKSMLYTTPVSEILASALPWTLFIMSLSLLLTFGIGIALGAFLAYREGGTFDVFTSSTVVWLNGVPYYVAALLFLYLFGYRWGWFPVSGRVGDMEPGFNAAFITSALYHATLPVISVVITEFGGWALSMRGNAIQTLGEDYLRVARLRGLPDGRIAMRYVARNSILPMYTGLLIAIGFLFGGSVILEQVFAYPGVGFFMVRGINARDYPLMMGGFLVITMAVVIGIFIADLTYGFIDPRIRTQGGED